MIKEQSSMEKINIKFVCLNEAICPIIPQRLADQKQKYRDMLENSLKLCGYCKHQILREFEELK